MSDGEQAESAFDELTAWLAAELERTHGDIPAQTTVLEEAVRRYADARRFVDPEEPYSYVVHFFGVDGVGWEKARTPTFARVTGASKDDRARWSMVLADVAARLEAAMFA